MRPFLVPDAHGPVHSSKRPTFSIVIAAYNSEATVGEAIESALTQTTEPLEVIVCDDGSTDATRERIEPFGNRIVFLPRPHRGVASAKNSALNVARGDFVAILDADDVYAEERIEALTELATSRPDLDILTTDALLEGGGTVLRRYYEGPVAFAVRDQRRRILETNFILGLAAVRRNRLREIGGFDEAMIAATDWDCWIRLILSGSQAGLVNEPLARYRLQPSGLSSQRVRRSEGRVRAVEKALAAPSLTEVERAAAAASLAAQRRELLVVSARAALLARRSEARHLLLRIARTSGFDSRLRLRAIAAAMLPGLARRHARRLERRSWVTAGGIRISR